MQKYPTNHATCVYDLQHNTLEFVLSTTLGRLVCSLLRQVRHMGDPGTRELAQEIAHNITWNASRLTGVAPSGWEQGAGQQGCYDREGANAFQSAGAEFASWINTSSWTHTVGVRGGGPQAQVYANLNGTTRPWKTRGAKLWIEAWVKLPVVSGHLAAPNVPGSSASSTTHEIRSAARTLQAAVRYGTHGLLATDVGASSSRPTRLRPLPRRRLCLARNMPRQHQGRRTTVT